MADKQNKIYKIDPISMGFLAGVTLLAASATLSFSAWLVIRDFGWYGAAAIAAVVLSGVCGSIFSVKMAQGND